MQRGFIFQQLTSMEPQPLWICVMGIFITMLVHIELFLIIGFLLLLVSFSIYTSVMSGSPDIHIFEMIGVILLCALNVFVYKSELL